MRFHHSTRRGRARNQQHQQENQRRGSRRPGSHWCELRYCRQSNIQFQRRLPVAAPEGGWPEPRPAAHVEELLAGLGPAEGAGEAPAAAPEQLEWARARLEQLVSRKPFWSGRAARQMQLLGSELRHIYLYELSSQCEERQLEWRYQPYRGGLAGAPGSVGPQARAQQLAQQPERVWSIEWPEPEAEAEAQAEADRPPERASGPQQQPAGGPDQPGGRAEPLFANRRLERELPGSAFVKQCHGCAGKGRLKCSTCGGAGYEVCLACSGKGSLRCLSRGAAEGAARPGSPGGGPAATSGGQQEDALRLGRRDEHWPDGGQAGGWLAENCHLCQGAGQVRCWLCVGRAYSQCLGCQGAGQLRCHLQLCITRTCHRDELVLNNADQVLNKDRVRLCKGRLLLEQVAPRLGPLVARLAGEPADAAGQLAQASRHLHEQHLRLYGRQRLLRQRHRLTQIQCQVVHYEWKQRRGHFVVYGREQKLYVAKYPFKSLCSIV